MYDGPEVVLELRLRQPFEDDVVQAIKLGPPFRFVDKEELDPFSRRFRGFGKEKMSVAIEVLKERAQTSDMIREASAILGKLMAEHVEDKCGWNGEKCRDQAEEYRERIR